MFYCHWIKYGPKIHCDPVFSQSFQKSRKNYSNCSFTKLNHERVCYKLKLGFLVLFHICYVMEILQLFVNILVILSLCQFCIGNLCRKYNPNQSLISSHFWKSSVYSYAFPKTTFCLW